MANRDMLSLSAIARAVWNLVAIASRTVTVTTNSDKTGYALTSTSTGVIKNIERNTITLGDGVASNTATITAVDTAKTILSSLGQTGGGSGGAGAADNMDVSAVRLALTNSTTVTASRNVTGDTERTIVVGFQVVEYY